MIRIQILVLMIVAAALCGSARGQLVVREDSLVAGTVYARIDLVDWLDHPCGEFNATCGDQNYIVVQFDPWPLWPEEPSNSLLHHDWFDVHPFVVHLQQGINYEISGIWDVAHHNFYPDDPNDPCWLVCRSTRTLETIHHVAGSTVAVQASTWGAVKALYRQ